MTCMWMCLGLNFWDGVTHPGACHWRKLIHPLWVVRDFISSSLVVWSCEISSIHTDITTGSLIVQVFLRNVAFEVTST